MSAMDEYVYTEEDMEKVVKEQNKELLETPVLAIGLSTRTANTLKRYFETVGDVLNAIKANPIHWEYKIRNLGLKGRDETFSFLVDHNLIYGTVKNPVFVAAVKPTERPKLQNRFFRVKNMEFGELVDFLLEFKNNDTVNTKEEIEQFLSSIN